MLLSLNKLKWGPATVLIIILVVLVAIGGIVVVIAQPKTLTLQQYVNDMWHFAQAVGLLAVGRGLHLGLAGVPAGGDGDNLTGDPVANFTAGEDTAAAESLTPDPEARTGTNQDGTRQLASPPPIAAAEAPAAEPLAPQSGVPTQ